MVVEFFPLHVEDLDIPIPFGSVSFDNSTILEGVLSDDSCKVNPCHHNGICVNTWNDYRCQCSRGFKGKDCMELEFCELEEKTCPENSKCRNLEDGYECITNATFNGEMPPLLYNLAHSSVKELNFDSLEITYRTRSWGTALFAKHMDHYFIIFIYHDHVLVQWNIGNSVHMRSFQKEHFDGQWVTLHFEIKENVLKGGFKEMVNDDTPNFVAYNFDSANFSELFSEGTIYVAGSDNSTFNYRFVLENEDFTNMTYVTLGDTTTDNPLISNVVDLPENGITTNPPFPLYKPDINRTTDSFKVRFINILQIKEIHFSVLGLFR